jgi:hypothetical protein
MDGGFDGAVGFVGGDEDVVGVGRGRSGEVDEEVVLVGHEHVDLVDEVGVVERGFAHGVEGLLDGERVVLGEGGEHDFAEVGADLVEVDAGGDGFGGVGPLGFEGGAEEAVGGFGERGEGVLDVAGEGGVGGLEDGEAVEAGGDGEGLI